MYFFQIICSYECIKKNFQMKFKFFAIFIILYSKKCFYIKLKFFTIFITLYIKNVIFNKKNLNEKRIFKNCIF